MSSAFTSGICRPPPPLVSPASTPRFTVYANRKFRHFTQLVAVGPFAVLGLVLMACTARVCKITGITDLYEEIGSEDMRMTLQMIDDGAVEDELGSLLTGGDVDEGVVIEREE